MQFGLWYVHPHTNFLLMNFNFKANIFIIIIFRFCQFILCTKSLK